MNKTIISLYDYTGNWSQPYRENGYNVIQVDIQKGVDILTWQPPADAYGILIAQPCTDYAVSGAKHFAAKDADGRTEQSQLLVARTKQIIDLYNLHFWVLENPRTRIHKLNRWIGQRPKFVFNPTDFAGDDPIPGNSRYNKETWLFGKFNDPALNRLEPLQKDWEGWKSFGGSSIETKNARSITPLGFAYAFYNANK